MKVLSLFDGISCARVALERAGIKVDKYYASEIDKYAIQISKKNYPDIVHIGDVKNINGLNFQDIDLLIGGSPCQDLSIAKKDRQGLKGERSGLFYEYVRILKEARPKYYILENVASMKKEDRNEISSILGIEPIMINAALISAQQRKRLFWTNIKYIRQPIDKRLRVADILNDIGFPKSSDYINRTYKISKLNKGGQGNRIYSIYGKSICLSANGGGRGAKTGLYEILGKIRKLNPIECERLQGLPVCYTEGISNTQRYKCLGNAFNVDVVAHILSYIKD